MGSQDTQTLLISDRARRIPTVSEQEPVKSLPSVGESGGMLPLNLKHADTKYFPPPQWSVQGLKELVHGEFEPYTPFRGDPTVLEAVAENVSGFLGVTLDPKSDIVLSAGTQGGLFAAMSVLAQEGEEVAVLDPDYMSTSRTLRFLGCKPRSVPLLKAEGSARIDTEALEQALQQGVKLFMFSNPNNPTGAVFPREVLQEVARLIVEYDAFVIADELYSRLVFDNREFVHLVSLPGMKERCITALGPSKAESMSGFRLGCLIVPAELSNAVESVVGVTSMRAPAYFQPLLAKWLRDDRDLMAKRQQEYEYLRDETVEVLSSNEDIDFLSPQGSSYIFVRLKNTEYTDDQIVEFLWEYAAVKVNPGYEFGQTGYGGFRMCIAQDRNIWRERLQMISDALSKLSI